MFVHVHWSAICMKLFMIFSSIATGQSSANNLQIYSEIDKIIEYGNKIFGAIINYRQSDGDIIEKLRRIANETKIQELMDRIPPNILDRYSCKRERGLSNVESMLQLFDTKYSEFEQYCLQTNGEALHDKFIMNIFILHDSGYINSLINDGLKWNMFNDPWSDYELFGTLVDLDNPMERNCSRGQSLNQYIYELYNTILHRFTKIHETILYSYTKLLLKIDDPKIDNSPEQYYLNRPRLEKGLAKAVQDLEANSRKLTDNALRAIGRLSRNILSNDPSAHIKGTTYTSLDYFLQGYVTDQKYLSPNGNCMPTCSQYTNTIHYNQDDQRLFPRNSICAGVIHACDITAVEKMCLAPIGSTRRYDGLFNVPWIGEELQKWGHISENCTDSTAINLKSTQSVCRVCHCTCDMTFSYESIRYIDLRPLTSLASNSYVITGIRFKVINRILTLQIREGELRNGRIFQESVNWLEVNEVEGDHEFNPNIFKLDYYHRLMDLAVITLPTNYAVTMVGFTIVDNIVGLQIEGHPIVDGELNSSDLVKISNQSVETISSRPVFHPDGIDIPIRDTVKNSKVTEPNRFLLQFETSDWVKDAGQNVVPFIDLQDVVTDPPEPIAGFGVHVRYGDTSGGFLALKLISIDNGMKLRQFGVPIWKTDEPDVEINSEQTHSFVRFG